MAVKDPNAQSNNDSTQGTEKRDFGNGSRQQTQEVVQASLLDFNRLLGGPMSRRTTGASLVQAIQAVKYWFSPEKRLNSGSFIDLSKVQVLGLDAQEHNVGISSVILTYPIEQNGELIVMSSVMVLESTLVDESRVRQIELNGRGYPVPVVASDFVTEAYMALIDDIIIKNYSTTRRNVTVMPAGWRTVDSGVDFSDPDVTEVRDVIFYAQLALVTCYNLRFQPDTYFNLEWLTKGSHLEIKVDLLGNDIPTADGLPRRNDICISVNGLVKTNDGTAKMALASVSGYISLLYTPPADDGPRRRGGRRHESSYEPYFTPTFIINRIDSGQNAITPELMLLALAAASVITKNQAWVQSMLPGDIDSRDDIDAKDTGYLNLLGPDAADGKVEFDGRGNSDFIGKWEDYFFDLVDEDMAWAIELEDGGDNAWLTSLLTEVAEDRSSHGGATDLLFQYADQLTMNNFTRRANEIGLNSPLTMSGARYLTGTWVDSHGNKRDLRDWDLLRWLAVSDGDVDVALRYQDVIDRTEMDVEIRVSEQYEQLVSALGEKNVKFCRYVDLAFINPDFIDALTASVSDCRIIIDQAQASYSFGQKRKRGNTRVRDFRGGDLTHGMLNRRSGGDDFRGGRNRIGNGLGRNYSF
jgi:hypothetical protein